VALIFAVQAVRASGTKRWKPRLAPAPFNASAAKPHAFY
jgi:hypothetical protein